MEEVEEKEKHEKVQVKKQKEEIAKLKPELEKMKVEEDVTKKEFENLKKTHDIEVKELFENKDTYKFVKQMKHYKNEWQEKSTDEQRKTIATQMASTTKNWVKSQIALASKEDEKSEE